MEDKFLICFDIGIGGKAETGWPNKTEIKQVLARNYCAKMGIEEITKSHPMLDRAVGENGSA